MEDRESLKSDYASNGYALIREAAPLEVANAFLGIVTASLAQPGVSARLYARPTVNTKPSYEFYSSMFPTLSGIHWGLTSLMRSLSGKRLTRTYAFFRAYQFGDICTVHSDRPACDHSMSLALGYADGIIWPFECGKRHYEFEEACKLKCENAFGEEEYSSVLLRPGDAIAYRGVNRRHGRMTPNPNRWSAHAFLHWVDMDGPYAEWAFDKRTPYAPGEFDFTPKSPA
jgi:hypothetical protein